MDKIENYLQIMIDSLAKKEDLLDRIIEKNRKQYECVKGKEYDSVDWDAFNLLVTEKDIAINQIVEIDDGFEETYNIIKDEVMANKVKYRDKVSVLKEQIGRLTDKGISIQADEERNRQIIDNLFNKSRQDIKKQRTGISVANAYYKTMSNSVVRASEISMLDTKK